MECNSGISTNSITFRISMSTQQKPTFLPHFFRFVQYSFLGVFFFFRDCVKHSVRTSRASNIILSIILYTTYYLKVFLIENCASNSLKHHTKVFFYFFLYNFFPFAKQFYMGFCFLQGFYFIVLTLYQGIMFHTCPYLV